MSNVETQSEGHSARAVTTAPRPPEFAAANGPSYARTLFLGPDGLRPGWGFAFYVLMFYGAQRLAVEWAWAHDLGASGLWSGLLEEFGNVLAALIPAVVLARVEGRRWRMYGLPPKEAFGQRFWMGVIWGLSAISLLMFTLYTLHAFSFGHLALHGVHILRFAVYWSVMFVLVGLFEEFLLRGYTQFTLARGVGFWPAAITLSCAFGLTHLRNNGEHWRGLIAAALIGFFFCLTLRRMGTLWFAVGFHAAWDWGETFLYSVPDSGMVSPGHLLSSSRHGPDWLSGGSVGPEGSVLCFAVVGLVCVVFNTISWPERRSSEHLLLSTESDFS